MTDCVRCGAAIPKAGKDAGPQVCGKCWDAEYERTDCALCGSPKRRIQKPHTRPFIICADCQREVHLNGQREAMRRLNQRRYGETIQREHAEAPELVSEDPLGTFHLGQSLPSPSFHPDQEEGRATHPPISLRHKVKRWDGKTVEVIDDGEHVTEVKT